MRREGIEPNASHNDSMTNPEPTPLHHTADVDSTTTKDVVPNSLFGYLIEALNESLAGLNLLQFHRQRIQALVGHIEQSFDLDTSRDVYELIMDLIDALTSVCMF